MATPNNGASMLVNVAFRIVWFPLIQNTAYSRTPFIRTLVGLELSVALLMKISMIHKEKFINYGTPKIFFHHLKLIAKKFQGIFMPLLKNI